MKIISIIGQSLFATFLFIAACSSSATNNLNTNMSSTVPDTGKILIVYLSRTNNTKAVAAIIHLYVGGKIVALELETAYPENYKATVEQVVKENETGYLPPLKTKIDNMGKYTMVFIGFPTWDMKMPPPMKSFLNQYNFSGKTIIPFNTNAGYGVGSGFQTVKELCPDSKVLEGFEIKGGIEKERVLLAIKGEKATEAESKVKTWLKKLKILK